MATNLNHFHHPCHAASHVQHHHPRRGSFSAFSIPDPLAPQPPHQHHICTTSLTRFTSPTSQRRNVGYKLHSHSTQWLQPTANPNTKTLRVAHATELHFGRELAQCDRKVTGFATLRSRSGSRPRHSSEARIPRARPSQWGHRRRGGDLGWEVGGERNEERYRRLRSDRK